MASLKRKRFAKALRARILTPLSLRCWTCDDKSVTQRAYSGRLRSVCAWCASAIDQEKSRG